MKITDKEIRQFLGHGQGNRKVRIKKDGEIHYYGSINAFDRQHDYWHYGGSRDDIVTKIKSLKK